MMNLKIIGRYWTSETYLKVSLVGQHAAIGMATERTATTRLNGLLLYQRDVPKGERDQRDDM